MLNIQRTPKKLRTVLFYNSVISEIFDAVSLKRMKTASKDHILKVKTDLEINKTIYLVCKYVLKILEEDSPRYSDFFSLLTSFLSNDLRQKSNKNNATNPKYDNQIFFILIMKYFEIKYNLNKDLIYSSSKNSNKSILNKSNNSRSSHCSIKSKTSIASHSSSKSKKSTYSHVDSYIKFSNSYNSIFNNAMVKLSPVYSNKVIELLTKNDNSSLYYVTEIVKYLINQYYEQPILLSIFKPIKAKNDDKSDSNNPINNKNNDNISVNSNKIRKYMQNKSGKINNNINNLNNRSNEVNKKINNRSSSKNEYFEISDDSIIDIKDDDMLISSEDNSNSSGYDKNKDKLVNNEDFISNNSNITEEDNKDHIDDDIEGQLFEKNHDYIHQMSNARDIDNIMIIDISSNPQNNNTKNKNKAQSTKEKKAHIGASATRENNNKDIKNNIPLIFKLPSYYDKINQFFYKLDQTTSWIVYLTLQLQNIKPSLKIKTYSSLIHSDIREKFNESKNSEYNYLSYNLNSASKYPNSQDYKNKNMLILLEELMTYKKSLIKLISKELNMNNMLTITELTQYSYNLSYIKNDLFANKNNSNNNCNNNFSNSNTRDHNTNDNHSNNIHILKNQIRYIKVKLLPKLESLFSTLIKFDIINPENSNIRYNKYNNIFNSLNTPNSLYEHNSLLEDYKLLVKKHILFDFSELPLFQKDSIEKLEHYDTKDIQFQLLAKLIYLFSRLSLEIAVSNNKDIIINLSNNTSKSNHKLKKSDFANCVSTVVKEYLNILDFLCQFLFKRIKESLFNSSDKFYSSTLDDIYYDNDKKNRFLNEEIKNSLHYKTSIGFGDGNDFNDIDLSSFFKKLYSKSYSIGNELFVLDESHYNNFFDVNYDSNKDYVKGCVCDRLNREYSYNSKINEISQTSKATSNYIFGCNNNPRTCWRRNCIGFQYLKYLIDISDNLNYKTLKSAHFEIKDNKEQKDNNDKKDLSLVQYYKLVKNTILDEEYSNYNIISKKLKKSVIKAEKIVLAKESILKYTYQGKLKEAAMIKIKSQYSRIINDIRINKSKNNSKNPTNPDNLVSNHIDYISQTKKRVLFNLEMNQINFFNKEYSNSTQLKYNDLEFNKSVIYCDNNNIDDNNGKEEQTNINSISQQESKVNMRVKSKVYEKLKFPKPLKSILKNNKESNDNNALIDINKDFVKVNEEIMLYNEIFNYKRYNESTDNEFLGETDVSIVNRSNRRCKVLDDSNFEMVKINDQRNDSNNDFYNDFGEVDDLGLDDYYDNKDEYNFFINENDENINTGYIENIDNIEIFDNNIEYSNNNECDRNKFEEEDELDNFFSNKNN